MQFGPTFQGKDFPAEMRRQLWPLCCGASIISGFKGVYNFSEEEIVKQITETMAGIPDFQVYKHETMQPNLTFLTLNNDQMASPKIMSAIEKAGFVKIGEASPRQKPQGFFIRDESKSWKSVS